jgi:hypothetical protein
MTGYFPRNLESSIVFYMETCDRAVIEAREALLKARDPRMLTRVELMQEVLRFRKYTGWMIVLNDDWADMDYDDEVSQVMISGGVYLAPSDTAKLCDPCCAVLNLVWDAENKKDASSQTATSHSVDSAA